MNAPPPPKPLLKAPIRHALALIAFIVGGWLGFNGGSALAYAIAGWTGREIGELIAMLTWSTLAGGLVGAVAGVWGWCYSARDAAPRRKTPRWWPEASPWCSVQS
jgi:hypothetical protein